MKFSILLLSSLFLFSSCSSEKIFREEMPVASSMGAPRTPASDVIYSQQTIGNTTVTTSGGITTLNGPGGITIVNNSSSDQFSGSWTDGMRIPLQRVVLKDFYPDKILINDFDIKLSDNNQLTILALTAEENDKEKNERATILWKRAEAICNMSSPYKYVYSIVTKAKWFSGMLIDLSKKYKDKDGEKYVTYDASRFEGARYFSELVCGRNPKEY